MWRACSGEQTEAEKDEAFVVCQAKIVRNGLLLSVAAWLAWEACQARGWPVLIANCSLWCWVLQSLRQVGYINTREVLTGLSRRVCCKKKMIISFEAKAQSVTTLTYIN